MGLKRHGSVVNQTRKLLTRKLTNGVLKICRNTPCSSTLFYMTVHNNYKPHNAMYLYNNNDNDNVDDK